MKKILLMVIFLFVCASVARGQGTATTIRYGTSLPATCVANKGQLFSLTSGTKGLYECKTTNTWTLATIPVLPSDATKYLDGTGLFSVPVKQGAGARAVFAVDYGVFADADYSCQASWTNTSTTVTTASEDVEFTSGDIGDIVYGYSTPCAGNWPDHTADGVLQVPLGTITAVGGAHSMTISSAATGTCTSSGPTSCTLVWGAHNDTTALQAFFDAVVGQGKSKCSIGILPAGNMLFNAPIVNSTSTCGNSPGLSGNMTVNGFGIIGQGYNVSLLMPMPNLDATTAFPASGNRQILFGSASVQGTIYANFGVFGAGNSTVTNGTNKCILYAGWLSTVTNVMMTEWGMNTSGLKGLCINGSQQGPAFVDNYLNYAGSYQCLEVALFVNLTDVQCATWYGSTFGNTENYSSHGMYWGGNNGTQYAINVTSGTLYSDADFLKSAVGSLFVDNGATFRGEKAHLYPDGFGITLNNGTAYLGNSIIDSSTGSKASIRSSGAGSKFYDLGGNKILSGSGAPGTSNITYYGSSSATGVTQTTGNWSVPSGSSAGQWGTSPSVATCSGSSSSQECTITVGSSTIGSNPVLTVTFPTTLWPFPSAPRCRATQIGGTQAISPFVTTSTSVSTAVFTYQTTPTAGNTLIVDVNCEI